MTKSDANFTISLVMPVSILTFNNSKGIHSVGVIPLEVLEDLIFKMGASISVVRVALVAVKSTPKNFLMPFLVAVLVVDGVRNVELTYKCMSDFPFKRPCLDRRKICTLGIK